MLKDYTQRCFWESWPCGSFFGISPLRLFLLLSTAQFLFSFTSPIALPLPERRRDGRDVHPRAWRTARTMMTSTVRACTLTGLRGLRTIGPLRGERWNAAFPGVACKGLRPVAVWSEHADSPTGSHRSLLHEFLLPDLSVYKQTLYYIPLQPQLWLSAHVNHHPNTLLEMVWWTEPQATLGP